MDEPIITKEGMFYSNFSDRFQMGLYFIEGSNVYSPKLVEIREKYGIKVGPQQPINGQIFEGAVGLYIVDWAKYLEDKNNKQSTISPEEFLKRRQEKIIKRKSKNRRI